MIEKYTNGVWAELAGYKKYSKITFDFSSFPASFQSEGVNMSDYRIYGANDGVGEQTENLFDGQIEQGYYAFADGQRDATSFTASKWVCTTLVPCNGNTAYSIRAELSTELKSRSYGVVWFDSSLNFISSNNFSTLANPVIFDVMSPSSAAYYAVDIAGTESLTPMIPNNINNITIIAGSTVPAQYIPFGYQINAVVRSENLFDKDAQDPGNGFMNGYYLFEDGRALPYSGYQISEYIAASEQTIYYLFSFVDSGSAVSICFYGENKTFISGERILGKESVVSPFGARFLRITVQTALRDNSTLTISPSAPTQYIPYSRTDIPIYIGDTTLAQGEYVDYGEQKVYKYVDSTLTPTDPPVALPALPTIDGATIVDFDNTPKPSRMTGEAIGWTTMTPKIYENGAWADLT